MGEATATPTIMAELNAQNGGICSHQFLSKSTDQSSKLFFGIKVKKGKSLSYKVRSPKADPCYTACAAKLKRLIMGHQKLKGD